MSSNHCEIVDSIILWRCLLESSWIRA